MMETSLNAEGVMNAEEGAEGVHAIRLGER